MNIKIDIDEFRVKPGQRVNLSQVPTRVEELYEDKKDYKNLLREYQDEIKDLQNMMYAHDRHAMLLIFQGMDCAGKDGAIKHVMSGVNPAGVEVHSFKKPSDRELDHDFMWRCTSRAPQRGRIGIFNRSYYEEVLVVRVHPEILTKYQRVPRVFTGDLEKVWLDRSEDIVNWESFMHRNGTHTVKFFIHISKQEQTQRLLDRIDRPDKNWKMSLGDMEERKFFPQYQDAFEKTMRDTSKENTPWYIIPGDDKKNARLIISQILLHHMRGLDMHYPKVTEDFKAQLEEVRKILLAEDKG